MSSSSYMSTCPYTGMLTVDLFPLSFCCCNKNTNQNQPAEELFATEGGQSRNPSRSLEAETRKECCLLACLACFLKLPRTTFLEATLPIIGCPCPHPLSVINQENATQVCPLANLIDKIPKLRFIISDSSLCQVDQNWSDPCKIPIHVAWGWPGSVFVNHHVQPGLQAKALEWDWPIAFSPTARQRRLRKVSTPSICDPPIRITWGKETSSQQVTRFSRPVHWRLIKKSLHSTYYQDRVRDLHWFFFSKIWH